ncbi:MAG TPA: hypothetical protein IGS17_00895 [Oscillatoriales cyanobacterium M59_W2019_021]|nr:MAG: hypothetical protein D6728_12505 [Cyanobacteria bacterium J055]HIK32294.1 hypothetical protein [Oscillatoriales cyanobacterium M4454_W2019_049]HIK49471.1 hypothetical protein [Oscillatoriales cyanobacterium M59_W2019_021]
MTVGFRGIPSQLGAVRAVNDRLGSERRRSRFGEEIKPDRYGRAINERTLLDGTPLRYLRRDLMGDE